MKNPVNVIACFNESFDCFTFLSIKNFGKFNNLFLYFSPSFFETALPDLGDT